jgi:hypothetical protein
LLAEVAAQFAGRLLSGCSQVRGGRRANDTERSCRNETRAELAAIFITT